MPKYQVSEIYPTVQGEGWFTGMPCTLVRFQGCNLRCSFCDTKYTWDPKGGDEMVLDRLVEAIKEVHLPGRMILLTGGEPTLQALGPLLYEIHHLGPVHLETNGTVRVGSRLREWITWITVSPKEGPLGMPEISWRCDEIKWLVAWRDDIARLKEYLKKSLVGNYGTPRVSLQPVSQDKTATAIALQACLDNNWRLSLQTHKFIGVK